MSAFTTHLGAVLLLLLAIMGSSCHARRFSWLKAPHSLSRSSSDGCGPNPITVLMAAVAELGPDAGGEVLTRLESDRSTWQELLQLLQEYDDCVRTGDGTRYRRSVSRAAYKGNVTPAWLHLYTKIATE